MSAVPIRIADAVVAEINAAVTASSFSTLGFTAVRRYFDWDADYKDLDTMAVEVVFRVTQPRDSIALESAGTLSYKVATDIVIRKRFATSDRNDSDGRLKNTSVDPLVTLLQEFHELFVTTRNTIPLDSETSANWTGSDVLSWVNQAKLRQGLFEGVVRIEFDFQKAV